MLTMTSPPSKRPTCKLEADMSDATTLRPGDKAEFEYDPIKTTGFYTT